MSKQIQAQAAKLWQTVSDPETSATYKRTGTLTWTIVKETGYLLWLVVCLVLVLGDWIWKTGYETGFKFRGWVNNLDQPRTGSREPLSETGQNLLAVTKASLTKAIATAKEQLGIEEAATSLEVTAPVTPAAPPPPAPATITPIAPEPKVSIPAKSVEEP